LKSKAFQRKQEPAYSQALIRRDMGNTIRYGNIGKHEVDGHKFERLFTSGWQQSIEICHSLTVFTC